jgi:uncharacterized membrane protein YeaQ/YmgE (transglycosylase-associated protein family)
MSLVAFLISTAIIGLLVGALARLALPGRDPLTIPQTMLVGIGGSLVAGVVGRLILSTGFGFALAVLFSTGIVYAIRRSRGGTLTRPADPARLRR